MYVVYAHMPQNLSIETSDACKMFFNFLLSYVQTETCTRFHNNNDNSHDAYLNKVKHKVWTTAECSRMNIHNSSHCASSKVLQKEKKNETIFFHFFFSLVAHIMYPVNSIQFQIRKTFFFRDDNVCTNTEAVPVSNEHFTCECRKSITNWNVPWKCSAQETNTFERQNFRVNLSCVSLSSFCSFLHPTLLLSFSHFQFE